MINERLLIIPDVHGRDFWMGPVLDTLSENAKKEEKTKIVFLGDYLDPYGYEGINFERAIEVFKEIIDIKKEHKDEIVLLIGNHDSSYIGPEWICQCRHSYTYHHVIRELFLTNIDLFDVAFEIDSKTKEDTKILFSHAGVTTLWMRSFDLFEDKNDVSDIDTILNDGFKKAMADNKRADEESVFNKFWGPMGAISHYRGGYGPVGSIIWSDSDEHLSLGSNPQGLIQIYGHSQLQFKPEAFEIEGTVVYNLDIREAFYLDNEDNVKSYNGDKIVEPVKLKRK